MRKQFCGAMVARAVSPSMIFLTGDLGFMALEPVQLAMGERFINAGVAEQNMISVAAAMANEGFEVWAYSIAPFCYARPFEQIRNDVCFHNLPVKLVGNGGGYGYGVMGPTHHAIEDYGILLTLPNMVVFVPVFDEDVESTVQRAANILAPAYLRLGRGEPPKGYEVPTYAPWRQLCSGKGPVAIAVGPIAGTLIGAFNCLPDNQRPNFWVIAELPIALNPIPEILLEQLSKSDRLLVIEEHVSHGGFASDLLLHLSKNAIEIPRLRHCFARAHRYDRYGSQQFLRQQSGLDPASILAMLRDSEYA